MTFNGAVPNQISLRPWELAILPQRTVTVTFQENGKTVTHTEQGPYLSDALTFLGWQPMRRLPQRRAALVDRPPPNARGRPLPAVPGVNTQALLARLARLAHLTRPEAPARRPDRAGSSRKLSTARVVSSRKRTQISSASEPGRASPRAMRSRARARRAVRGSAARGRRPRARRAPVSAGTASGLAHVLDGRSQPGLERRADLLRRPEDHPIRPALAPLEAVCSIIPRCCRDSSDR